MYKYIQTHSQTMYIYFFIYFPPLHLQIPHPHPRYKSIYPSSIFDLCTRDINTKMRKPNPGTQTAGAPSQCQSTAQRDTRHRKPPPPFPSNNTAATKRHFRRTTQSFTATTHVDVIPKEAFTAKTPGKQCHAAAAGGRGRWQRSVRHPTKPS